MTLKSNNRTSGAPATDAATEIRELCTLAGTPEMAQYYIAEGVSPAHVLRSLAQAKVVPLVERMRAWFPTQMRGARR